MNEHTLVIASKLYMDSIWKEPFSGYYRTAETKEI